MEGKQGYIRGMDQDSTFTKRDPNGYFAAHNFRVVTDGGSSSGSLETEKGTKLGFKVPNLGAMILDSAFVIPAQEDLHIIGSASMVDDIIIFTTSNTSKTPTSYGQIWRCKYDEVTDTIIGLTGTGELDPAIHLVYNQKMNFSTEYRIGRAVAIYETKDKQRVYWTDNYNPTRTFNLAEPNSLNVPLPTIDIFPGATLTQPTIRSIISGGLTSGTQVQFTYVLLNKGGAKTAYAPPTPMTPLPNVSVQANNFDVFQGGSGSSNKGVVYELNSLDTNYEIIEHIAIQYNSDGTLAAIWKFAEDSIPASGNMTVICTTFANATSISFEEYSIIEKGFDRCKDIEVQSNRLIAANISTDKTDFEFDARAYRFNDGKGVYQYAPVSPAIPLLDLPFSPIALLQDSSNNNEDKILLGGTGNTPDWGSIPKEHDCINIYNKEQELNWFAKEQQYRFQKDGVTLGGEGPNIKYEFTTIDMVGNTAFGSVTNAPNHIQVPSYQVNATPLYKGVLHADGTPQPIYRNNQIANMASAWAHANYNGYARGEIYRFGIVFYDKKGFPVFVEWIGDIKFPDVNEGYPLQSFDTGQAVLQQLGIKFSVDVTSIADKISGYSIVRLERDDINRTKLGTGFFMHFDEQRDNQSNSLMHRYFLTGLGLGSGDDKNDPFPVTGDYDSDGNDARFMHLSDRPGQTPLVRGNDLYNRIGYLISPFGNIVKSAHTNNDYIETLDYYRADLHHYFKDPNGVGNLGTDADFAFYYKMKHRQAPIHSLERIQVQDSIDVYAGQVISVDSGFMSGIEDLTVTTRLNCSNTSYTRDKAALIGGAKELVPLGIGSPRRVMRLHTPTTNLGSPDLSTNLLPHMSYQAPKWQNVENNLASTDWFGPNSFGNDLTINFGGDGKANIDVSFKSVGYRRYLDLQYRGNTYESRSTDSYLYIGHFQTIAPAAALNLTTEVYNGDTYVNYYDEEMIERYISGAAQNLDGAGPFKDSPSNGLGVAVCGPVESVVNTNYRTGRIWAKDRNINNMGEYAQNSSLILPVWNSEDKVQNQFFAEDFLAQFVEEHPAQLWASNIKINGELSDNWRDFPIANKTEVDGIYGPINRILSFKDRLMFYQDRAFGIASLDERSVIQDDSGQELVLGTGGVFPDYQYISTNTGTVHQFSVVDSENAVYHYDARLKKFFQYTGAANPLSDLKGMSSFFGREVVGEITDTDKTIRSIGAMGVHGTYDPRYNRVLFTFLKEGNPKQFARYQDKDGNWVFPDNTYLTIDGVLYFIAIGFTIPATSPPTLPDITSYKEVVEWKSSFTIGYNELAQSFESFYDYTPSLYLEYGRRLLSVSPFRPNEMHQHNKGIPGQYYDEIKSTSSIHTIFSNPGDSNKIWNNLAWNGEVYDEDGNDVYTDTMDRVHYFNNYQTTEVQDLSIAAKRRMRTWRTTIPREVDKELSRLRNPWLECVLEYDNIKGYRHVLHDLIYSFTPTKA